MNMKKLIYIFIVVLFTITFSSCEDGVDENNSIFDVTPPERNDLDVWLLENYIRPYNIEVMYRLDDAETNMDYELAPADYDKSILLSILVKHLWIEVYTEGVGIDFVKENTPKLIYFIGSPAYQPNGSQVLGTAEGGQKVTLYGVNELDNTSIYNPAHLTEIYFSTMHHEFAHILHQTKFYSEEYPKISDGDYVGDNCFDPNYTLANALGLGFVTRYARKSVHEDFVEVYTNYIISTKDDWELLLEKAEANTPINTPAGQDGRSKLELKLDIVRNYMQDYWNIDIDLIRDIIKRRCDELPMLNLTIK